MSAKKKRFADDATSVLKSTPTSMEDFLDGDVVGEAKTKSKVSKKTKSNEPKKTTPKPVKKEAVEEKVPEPKVRHEVRLEAELSEQIRFCMFANKIDKTKLFSLVIQNFFEKSESQQKRILGKK